MKNRISRQCVTLASVLMIGYASVSGAQLLDAVKGAAGGDSATSGSAAIPAAGAGALGALGGGAAGGLGIPALDSVGMGNLTGVLTYCAKNNYLGGDGSAVKDKLLGQLGGESEASTDAGYQQGVGGILGGDSGQQVDLSGDGLKKQLTEKVCDQVLEYGKSLV